jgi:hypothetical protein
MSTSRIADLQYDDAATAALGTNSYRLIKQTFQSVCALFFFEQKNGLNSVTGYTSASTPVTDVADGTDGDQAIVGLESEEGGFTEDVSKTGSKVQDREVRNKKPNTRVSGLDWVK